MLEPSSQVDKSITEKITEVRLSVTPIPQASVTKKKISDATIPTEDTLLWDFLLCFSNYFRKRTFPI